MAYAMETDTVVACANDAELGRRCPASCRSSAPIYLPSPRKAGRGRVGWAGACPTWRAGRCNGRGVRARGSRNGGACIARAAAGRRGLRAWRARAGRVAAASKFVVEWFLVAGIYSLRSEGIGDKIARKCFLGLGKRALRLIYTGSGATPTSCRSGPSKRGMQASSSSHGCKQGEGKMEEEEDVRAISSKNLLMGISPHELLVS